MSDFRTYHLKTRIAAVPMQPVVDPADWSAESLGPVHDWSYRITAQDRDELLAAVDHFRKLALPLPAVDRSSFPLPRLKDVLADIRRELMDGRGIVMVQDRKSDRPAVKQAAKVMNDMARSGVLVGLSGPHKAMRKIRPPMVFSRANADQLVQTLDHVLGSL